MFRRSNKNKLVANIFGLLCLGLLVSTLVAYQHVKSWQEQAIQNELKLKAVIVSKRLNYWVEQNLHYVEHFASFIEASSESVQKHSNFRDYILQQPKLKKLNYLGYTLDADGYYGINDWQPPEDFDSRQRPWYIEGKAAKRPIIGHPYISVEKTPKMLLAVTAPIIIQNEFVGLASAHIALDEIHQSLAEIDFDFGGQAFLIDTKGKVIIHEDTQHVGTLWEGFESITKAKKNTQSFMTIIESSTKQFFISSPSPELGWTLVFSVSKDSIDRELLKGTMYLLGKFLIIFILVIFGVYLSNRHILSPLFDYMELDSVTLLPNKKHFKQQLIEEFLKPVKKGKLVIINIDNFSRLTATYPAAHIHLLQNEIKGRIDSQLHNNSLLGSFSESRYIVYCDCGDHSPQYHCKDLLPKLSDVLSKSYQIAGQEINCSFRMGASYFPKHGVDVEKLIDNSFSALASVAKYTRKNYSIFSTGINQQFSDEQSIQSAIVNAIDNAEFTMVYQPQVNSNTGKMFAMESLVRWHSIELDRFVPPDEFIPIAERCGLMVALGDYITETVFKQVSVWNKLGVNFGKVSINVSAHQLLAEGFYSDIQQCVIKHNVSSKQIEFEITETSLLEEPITSIEVLNKLSKDGFSIAIDDFGTGYSSLKYLNDLPVDKLKIDRTFVMDIDKKPKSALLVQTIISMAINLNIDVLAEGVERIEEANKLSEFGCTQIQGYLYSRPLTPEAVLVLLDS